MDLIFEHDDRVEIGFIRRSRGDSHVREILDHVQDALDAGIDVTVHIADHSGEDGDDLPPNPAIDALQRIDELMCEAPRGGRDEAIRRILRSVRP